MGCWMPAWLTEFGEGAEATVRSEEGERVLHWATCGGAGLVSGSHSYGACACAGALTKRGRLCRVGENTFAMDAGRRGMRDNNKKEKNKRIM